MRARRSAVWSAVGFVAVYLVFIHTPWGQRIDETAMIRIAAAADSPRWAQVLLHEVSELSVLMAAVLLVVVTAVFRGARVALFTALTIGSVIVGAQLLKETLTRPSLLSEAIANSFPSGHVAAVAALGAALVVALPARFRALAVVAVAPTVFLTGLATVVLAWHRPSDVVGSVLLAATIAGLAGLGADRRTATSRTDVPVPPRPDVEPWRADAPPASIPALVPNHSRESAAESPVRRPRR